MKKTRHTTEQIIEKLRQADVALGKGQKVPEGQKGVRTIYDSSRNLF